MPDSAAALQQRLNYQFSDSSLLDLALSHRSYSAKVNNERLEFLGDSILNFVIGEALFNKFPKAKEGQLSRMRASLVKGATLSQLGQSLELGQVMKLGPGEMKSGGARRKSIVADAVEAIIGAAYMDGGMEASKKLVLTLYQSRLQEISLEDTVKDNKSRLQEWLQSKRMALPEYRVTAISGQSHAQSFEIECVIADLELTATGKGLSRRHAEQQAAGKLLEQIIRGEQKNG